MVTCLTRNKNRFFCFCLSLCTIMVFSACTPQSTPSMMNTAPIRLSHETVVEQIPLKDIDESRLSLLSQNYHRYGNGAVDLTMTYDPAAQNYTAMNAIHTLEQTEKTLRQKGVHQVYAQTMPVKSGKPVLMVSYNVARALAPAGCSDMPGLYDNKTGRDIGDYRFGCGVDGLIARQLARPSDLEGRSAMGARDGRREAVILDGYAAGVPRETLEGVERADLSAENE